MMLSTRYLGQSGVHGTLTTEHLGFATNTLREATYFSGELKKVEGLREALGALHGVVVSDFRYRPKDRAAWEVWLLAQDRLFLRGLAAKNAAAKADLERVEARLAELDAARAERMKPFYEARRRYADHVVQNEYELNNLYDPVVTVHPDEIFFEAFSKDESTYARVGATRALWHDEGDVQFGTTNIDFSHKLAHHLDRLRSYRKTSFAVGPGGIDVKVGEVVHKEKKIELPESWVQGFLQVQATMTMGLRSFDIAPIDLFNLLRLLVRRKTRTSPRALRFELLPGKKVTAVLEPWGHEVQLSGVYDGDKPLSIRTWGRDRIKTLARLLPVARRVRVYLAGFGLPSFYVVDLGDISFTLGLSGWTDNDWSGGAKFDLLTRRLDAKPEQLVRVWEALRGPRVAKDADVSAQVGLGIDETRSALSTLSQLGRATYDLNTSCWRHRDLFFDNFSIAEAKKATSLSLEEQTPLAKAARSIFESDNVRIIARRPVPTGYKLSGSALGTKSDRCRPQLHVDGAGQIIEGSCTCTHFREHQMTKGPCEHLLALRLAHMSKLESEQAHVE